MEQRCLCDDCTNESADSIISGVKAKEKYSNNKKWTTTASSYNSTIFQSGDKGSIIDSAVSLCHNIRARSHGVSG